MAKARQKRQHVGFGVEINRTGEKGAANWQGVGFIYGSRAEAESYRKFTFPSVKKYRVHGVRINIEPITGREEKERV